MRKVVTIELNGHLYQLDERGFDQLRAYLAQAEARLGVDPDKGEIIRDLEQSIAEKLLRYLGPEKSVVASDEVGQILQEIGPVMGPEAGAPHAGAADSSPASGTVPPRRLYLVQEGALIGGLCNGIATHFHTDPTLVRIIFIACAVTEMIQFDHPPVLTGGFYVALMFLVPYSQPSPGRPAAAGPRESIPQKVRRGVERVKAAFGALEHSPR